MNKPNELTAYLNAYTRKHYSEILNKDFSWTYSDFHITLNYKNIPLIGGSIVDNHRFILYILDKVFIRDFIDIMIQCLINYVDDSDNSAIRIGSTISPLISNLIPNTTMIFYRKNIDENKDKIGLNFRSNDKILECFRKHEQKVENTILVSKNHFLWVVETFERKKKDIKDWLVRDEEFINKCINLHLSQSLTFETYFSLLEELLDYDDLKKNKLITSDQNIIHLNYCRYSYVLKHIVTQLFFNTDILFKAGEDPQSPLKSNRSLISKSLLRNLEIIAKSYFITRKTLEVLDQSKDYVTLRYN